MSLQAPARTRILVILLLASAVTSTGCGLFWHKRKVARLPRIPMRTATLPQLVSILNSGANRIRTLNAKLTLVASTGGDKTGTVTEYRDINAYLLVRKPQDIRLIGQFSIVGTLFDMASDGNQFELSIPPQSKFITGLNNVIPAQVKNPLERLRPQIILQALLINPIAPNEVVAAMNDNADTKALYDVLVFNPPQNGVSRLVRRISFSRFDLLPRRQLIYDDHGNVATEASYGEFMTVQGIAFPKVIVIQRPQEQYSIKLRIEKLKLNQPLPRNRFVLRQPSGYTLIRLSGIQAPPPTPAHPPAPGTRAAVAAPSMSGAPQ